MIILNADETKKALPMTETIEAMKIAFLSLSDASAEMPLRTQIPVPNHDGITLLMPAYINKNEGAALAVKIVSIFNQNPSRGLPLLHAAVLVLDENSGRIEAIIEGATLTAIRTGAGSGVATDLLAKPDAKRLAIIGAGVQATTQLEAICYVRDISSVRVFSLNKEHAKNFVNAHKGQSPIPKDIKAANSAAEALENADIICTATTSHEAIFEDKDLKAGCHINAVGTFMPEHSEIPSDTVARADIFVDSLAMAGVEAGEIVQNVELGLIKMAFITEIGQLLAKKERRQSDPNQITLFKSVGLAVQDAAAGKLALSNAIKLNLGTQVNF